MTPKRTAFVVILIALVALGAHAVTADDAVPVAEPVALTLASGETVNVTPGDWVKAGEDYPALDPTIANVQAQLGPFWTWEGTVGTWGDGKTQVELLPGPPLDVRVIANHVADGMAEGVPQSRASDACLRAQVLLGTVTTMDETVAVCETSDQ